MLIVLPEVAAQGWLDRLPIDAEVLMWLGLASLGTLVLAALLLPVVVLRMPAEYFVQKPLPVSRAWWQVGLAILRNLLGAVFVLAGVLMLVLPGQGILTILIGLTWMDFPGKFALERWLVGLPSVLRALNWIRARGHREPFAPPT